MDAQGDMEEMDSSLGGESHPLGPEQGVGRRVAERENLTCRICRGEETPEEPLFHPCKCSGSIGHVHQACLMEWLSRSGKRHCELCKTSFRFTKLYDPRMPSSVPFPIFCRHAALHVTRLILKVSRWILVFFVWLAWVPWIMRLMWRFLFWLADGAWIEHSFHYDFGLPGSLGTLSISSYPRRIYQNSTFGPQVTEITHKSLGNSSSRPSLFKVFSDQVSKSIWNGASTNTTKVQQPLMLRLGIRLFKGIFPLASRRTQEVANTTQSMEEGPQHSFYRQTLLSDVEYLKSLTRWPHVNRFLMDIFEGQMITVFVMVFLILVFLIREWVVQQQPRGAIRVAAQDEPDGEERPAEGIDEADAHEARTYDADLVNTEAVEQAFTGHREIEDGSLIVLEYQSVTSQESYRSFSFEELRLADYNNLDYDDTVASQHNKGSVGDDNLESSSLSLHQENFEDPHSLGQGGVDATSMRQQPLAASNLALSVSDDAWSAATNPSIQDAADSRISALQSQRPQMPSRNALDKASRLHRVLEEERNKVAGDRWPGIATFMDFWNRGDCDPETVLEIIRKEERTEELAWIVHAMQRLQRPEESGPDMQTGVSNGPMDPKASGVGDPDLSNSSHGSWQVVDDVKDPNLEASELPRGNENSPKSILTNRPAPVPIVRDLSPHNIDTSTAIRAAVTEPTEPNARRFPEPGAGLPEVVRVQNPLDRQQFSLEDMQSRQTVEDLADGGETPDDINYVVRRIEELQDTNENGHTPLGPGSSTTSVRSEETPVQRSTLSALANAMWGDVAITATEQKQIFRQLQPIFQPEMEHEAPVAVPQPQAGRNANVNANADGNAHADADIGADADGMINHPPEGPLPDPDVMQAARDAGLDPLDAQAIEDGEELEGLVELVGLEGPLMALLQHAIVCAAIVALVVFLGIWIPYILGKVMLVIISNPFTLLVKLPLRWILFIAEAILDCGQFTVFGLYYWLDRLVRTTASPVAWMIPYIGRIQGNTIISDTAAAYSNSALQRLFGSFPFSGESLTDSDIPYFSIVAHESLVAFKSSIRSFASIAYAVLRDTLENRSLFTSLASSAIILTKSLSSWLLTEIKWELVDLPRTLFATISTFATNPLKLRLEFPTRTEPIDLGLIHWGAWDRFLAVALGYVTLYIAGSLYTKIVSAIKGQDDQQVDETIEFIQQARGVLKVILIISIEMIAFPLYCGVLLDIAMLPLFKEATILSRLAFSTQSPWTSLFLHWFVGACYMFHFALFVAMCRKDMRKGVLYFIRDPDDETFHPVRDVLERNLGGQLRKIGFSAVVYGALVIVCLGSVIWGLANVPWVVLPIRWSSADPTTELPIDLCIYNVLIPVAVKATKPAQALSGMYKWWFRTCARTLRISHFLFGDRRKNEEGYWIGPPDNAPDSYLIQNRILFDVLQTEDDDDESEIMDLDIPKFDSQLQETSRTNSKGGRFIRNGRFVRAPATDRVRIPRGQNTFLTVDENNNRLDGQPELKSGLHAKDNKQFKLVYLPPHFQIRIGLFAILLWGFAATTGLLSTIFPLTIGRVLVKLITPEWMIINDVQCFVLGAYVLGVPILTGIKQKKRLISAYLYVRHMTLRGGFDTGKLSPRFHQLVQISLRFLRLLYFYSFLGFTLPLLFSAVFCVYVMVPAYSSAAKKSMFEDLSVEVSLIQNWILGVLFTRVAGRAMQNNQDSQLTRALYGIVVPRNNVVGWLDPDTRLATRALVLPSIVMASVALLVPLCFGFVANLTYFANRQPEVQTLVYRFSYPAVAGAIIVLLSLRLMKRASSRWRSRIRDEVYLIGERLHNFGERRLATAGMAASSA